MAKYRVLATSFINNSIVEEGTVIEYDGTPASNLEPIDTAAQKAADGSKAADAESIARQKAAAAGAEPDAAEIANAVSAAAKAAETALATAANADLV